MAGYSTPEMIRKAISVSSDGGLPTTPTHTAADLADGALLDAIKEADALIDSYIGRFYVTPVALVDGAVPHPIDYWSRNIAAYNATLTYRGSQDLSDDDPVARRYRATMDALKAVNGGTAQLSLVQNFGDSSAGSAGAPINPFEGDLFTPDEFDLAAPNFDPVTGGIGSGPFWRSR